MLYRIPQLFFIGFIFPTVAFQWPVPEFVLTLCADPTLVCTPCTFEYSMDHCLLCSNADSALIADTLHNTTYGKCNLNETAIFKQTKYLDPPWPPPENDRLRLLLERWTNCFPSDDQKRRFAIGIILSNRTMLNRFENDIRQATLWMEAMVAATNLIFVPQLNIELYLKQSFYANRNIEACESLQIWNTQDICSQSKQCVLDLLTQLTQYTACNNGRFQSVGSVHLIEDHSTIRGAGVAYIGSICDETFKTAVDGFATNLFRTFAHELLHNFNGIHPIDLSGKVLTENIGILGYGDGKINNEYAIDEGNRPRICSKITERLNQNCVAFSSTQTVQPTGLPQTGSPQTGSPQTMRPTPLPQTGSPQTPYPSTLYPTSFPQSPYPSAFPTYQQEVLLSCSFKKLKFDAAVAYCDALATPVQLVNLAPRNRPSNYLWINYNASVPAQVRARTRCKYPSWPLRFYIKDETYACKNKNTDYFACCSNSI